jgi:hypothetical protein
MKRQIRKIMGVAALISLGMLPLSGQPSPELPSEKAWKEIASGTSLPSERTNPFENGLKAGRPTDEPPIGGMNAPVPGISLLSLFAFAVAAVITGRKRKEGN